MDNTSADRWFAALDQRRIGAGAGSWIAQVVGVHRDDDGFWVQVSSSEDPFSTIVLHLAPTTPIDDVVTALERHSRSAEGRPALIDLAAWPDRVHVRPSTASLPHPHRSH